MILDIRKHFSERGSVNAVQYAGLRQNDEPDCVYASIAGAVNHLAGNPVWHTARDLYVACRDAGVGSPTFDGVIPIALEPIPRRLRYELPRERIKNDSSSVLLGEIDSCLGSNGIAIISVEVYETQQRTTGLGCWHMLTIIDKAQNWYQVWDTNGRSGSIADAEIMTAFSGYEIECDGRTYPHTWFHRHNTHDCLLMWRV